MGKVIELASKENCTACMACKNVCPVQAIYLKSDEEGFIYPKIDYSKCIKCGKCRMVCSCLANKQYRYTEEEKVAYIFAATDRETVRRSSSGGFFTALCKEIIKRNGIVCSPGFDNQWNVKFLFVDSVEKIGLIQGSKYVEAEIGDTYIKCEEFLRHGKQVLFSGTPCQVRGILLYLKEKGVSYEDSLVTVAIICHGNASSNYWKRFINKVAGKGAVGEINFREKTYGYDTSTLAVHYKSGKVYYESYDNGFYLPAFIQSLTIRRGCYQCNFKSLESDADFVIGDYWIPVISYDGQTVVVAHSLRAQKIMKILGGFSDDNNSRICKISLEDAVKGNGNGNKENGCWIYVIKKPQERETFFNDVKCMELDKLQKKYFPVTFKKKVKKYLRPVRYRIKEAYRWIKRC